MNYRETIHDVPRPSRAQIRAFAGYVAQDHSWYKKLPMRGAGEPFFLYLHPYPHGALVDRQDGQQAWRPIVRGPRNPDHSPLWTAWTLGLEPGDVDPKPLMLQHYAKGLSTDERVARYGHWSYWNFGRPDQPRTEAVQRATAGLRIDVPAGEPVGVPPEGLERGLVYLRATVSGHMGPNDEEYERERETHGLPSVEEDCARQHDELVSAMERFCDWAYG